MYEVGETTCFNDVHVLDLYHLNWAYVNVIAGKGLERYNFCSFVFGEFLWPIGAFDGLLDALRLWFRLNLFVSPDFLGFLAGILGEDFLPKMEKTAKNGSYWDQKSHLRAP